MLAFWTDLWALETPDKVVKLWDEIGVASTGEGENLEIEEALLYHLGTDLNPCPVRTPTFPLLFSPVLSGSGLQYFLLHSKT